MIDTSRALKRDQSQSFRLLDDFPGTKACRKNKKRQFRSFSDLKTLSLPSGISYRTAGGTIEMSPKEMSFERISYHPHKGLSPACELKLALQKKIGIEGRVGFGTAIDVLGTSCQGFVGLDFRTHHKHVQFQTYGSAGIQFNEQAVKWTIKGKEKKLETIISPSLGGQGRLYWDIIK